MLRFTLMLLCTLIPLANAAIDIQRAWVRPAETGNTAVYMALAPTSGLQQDRLMEVVPATEIAQRGELHTHIQEGNVMKMRRVSEGFPLLAGAPYTLKPGGDHIMLMGLKKPLKVGDIVTLTLRFEKTEEMTISIPVLDPKLHQAQMRS